MHCRSTATGPGPAARWVGPTSPAPRLAAGRPLWVGAEAGTGRVSARGAPAVHKAGGSGAPRPGIAFPMRKSATAPFSRRRGPALVSLAKQDRPVLHKCTTRYSRSSMTAVQHEDGGAGPIRRLHGRPGADAALRHTRQRETHAASVAAARQRTCPHPVGANAPT